VDVDDDQPRPAWVIDELDDDPTDRARRRHLLLAAAAVPWVVVGALVMRSAAVDAPPQPAPSPTAAPPTAPSPTAAPPDPTTPPSALPSEPYVPSPAGGVPLDAGGGARDRLTLADVAAAAVPIARDHVTSIGPRLDGTVGEGATYAEHLTVEAIDHPAPDHAVVTVQAIVLTARRSAYTDARLVRVAVPLDLTDGVRPAGRPWPLPDPTPAPAAPLDGEPIDSPDAHAAARAALTEAGYRDVRVREVAATSGWPVVVTARARAPGEDEPAVHVVWTRAAGDGLVVAGWLPSQTQADRPSDEQDQP
jgi:hypothetical protein